VFVYCDGVGCSRRLRLIEDDIISTRLLISLDGIMTQAGISWDYWDTEHQNREQGMDTRRLKPSFGVLLSTSGTTRNRLFLIVGQIQMLRMHLVAISILEESLINFNYRPLLQRKPSFQSNIHINTNLSLASAELCIDHY
jgi:hypothetical protein